MMIGILFTIDIDSANYHLARKYFWYEIIVWMSVAGVIWTLHIVTL